MPVEVHIIMYDYYYKKCPYFLDHYNLQRQQNCMTTNTMYDLVWAAAPNEQLLITFKKSTGRKPDKFYFLSSAGTRNSFVMHVRRVKDGVNFDFPSNILCSISYI